MRPLIVETPGMELNLLRNCETPGMDSNKFPPNKALFCLDRLPALASLVLMLTSPIP